MRYNEFVDMLAELEQREGILELSNPLVAMLTEDGSIYLPVSAQLECHEDADGSYTLWLKVVEH